MTPAVKICGVTRAEDIDLCTELQVEYIGLNFVPGSPRVLPMHDAKRLRERITAAQAVGVFADAPGAVIQRAVSQLGLDMVQLHGQESVRFLEEMTVPVIKAFRSLPSPPVLEAFLAAGAYVMLDGKANGEQADWEGIAALPASIRSHLFLAGGLQPANVQSAIERVQPFAVDVASGVESAPGVKDATLVRDFVTAVRSSSPLQT